MEIGEDPAILKNRFPAGLDNECEEKGVQRKS